MPMVIFLKDEAGIVVISDTMKNELGITLIPLSSRRRRDLPTFPTDSLTPTKEEPCCALRTNQR